jgi:uncharacterized phiE125 gp8 family phage protein
MAEGRAQCRVDGTEEDALIQGYIDAATEVVQHRVGRVLMVQQWSQSLDCFPAYEIILPIGPVTEVTAIRYVDGDGETVTLAIDAYTVDTDSVEARIRPVDGWPVTSSIMNAVTLEWSAGGDCPPASKQAIRFLVGHYYANREAVTTGPSAVDLPQSVTALTAVNRRFRG